MLHLVICASCVTFCNCRNARRNWQRIQDHFFFATFHPLKDYSLEASLKNTIVCHHICIVYKYIFNFLICCNVEEAVINYYSVKSLKKIISLNCYGFCIKNTVQFSNFVLKTQVSQEKISMMNMPICAGVDHVFYLCLEKLLLLTIDLNHTVVRIFDASVLRKNTRKQQAAELNC